MKLKKLLNNKAFLLVLLGYGLTMFIDPSRLLLALKGSSYYLIEMVQIMPVVFMLTVLIEAWVPKHVISKSLGQDAGFKGNLMALLLGSISAGPIYAAFPICKALYKKGATIVNIVIILSVWAVIKVPMLANEAKFLGGEFMTVRWILTVVCILIMSYGVGYFVKAKDFAVKLTVQEEEIQVN
ncbi:permease [Fusibacter sp. A1]|nr:permease [Fusibacter sp. A1]RXV60376.1 permease [Fusibacter sp. A1]